MKNIAAVALFVAAGFVTAGSAMAQDHKVTATVPFSFSVNGRTLPAGHYTLGTDISTPSILTIADRERKATGVAIVVRNSGGSQTSDKLVFHRYGNQYFLDEICANGASMNYHLVPSKQEKWARAQTQEASLRVNNDVMIALK